MEAAHAAQPAVVVVAALGHVRPDLRVGEDQEALLADRLDHGVGHLLGLEDRGDRLELVERERAWSVNVKSHLYCARAVVPGMVERGEGYLVHTASAAGLLTQLGAAPYSVTKHAVVAFAEWLSITYGDAGVRVSVLCPQAVATNLVTTSVDVLAGKPVAVPPPRTDSISAAANVGAKGGAGADGVLSPDDVAAKVIEAIGEERFLILPHPEVETYEKRRADDRERWLRGMRRAQAQMAGLLKR